MADRFEFGKNWTNFLQHLNEARIKEAEKSLCEKLGVQDLQGKKFLDIGSGSGLFSLAAYRLGATVYSFDYDINSVNCTKHLKQAYAKDDARWTVEQGSVLDRDFLSKFSNIDIIYSWGVLHHTGNMYQAFENTSSLVNPGGVLFISIYNDQGARSGLWKKIKQTYVKSNSFVKNIIVILCTLRLWGPTFIRDLIKHGNPFKTWKDYGRSDRGMSPYYDIVDWVGGYPFEVARPEQVFHFFKSKGFQLQDMKTCAGGLGCNEFVFSRNHK